MIVTVGPVGSDAALIWTAQTLQNLMRVRRNARLLPFQLPADVADAFEALLREWHAIAAASPTFLWSADLDREWARRLVQYWANLDTLTEDHARRLGLEWSSPEARPFFAALAGAVAWGFANDEAAEPFAAFLTTRVNEPT